MTQDMVLVAQAEAPSTDTEAHEAEAGATETHATTETAADHGAEAAHAEEPHLLLEALLFGALIVVIAIAAKPAWKAITKSLDARAEKIRVELEEAARLREEAQSALAVYQRKQRDALSEAEAIVAHAKEEAARIRTQALADLEVTLKRREAMAMNRIAQAEAAAIADVRDSAVRVAIEASRKIITDDLGSDRAKATRLVEQAIADLPGRLN